MKRTVVVICLVSSCILGRGGVDAWKGSRHTPTADLLVSGLDGGSGSSIGPGGALYVTEAHAGRITRIDPRTGNTTTFASGLPKRMPGFPFGGAVDVAFIGKTAYVLVTLVGPDVGGSDVVGLYRVDGPDSFTVVADIGEYSLQNPPTLPFEYFVPSGAQYALETYQGKFLVTDGHLNRVLEVSRDGRIEESLGMGNVVPTGLSHSGNTVYVALAGPVPHLPQDGRVVSFRTSPRGWPRFTEVASGAPLLVDVEFGRGQRLYGLSQGTFPVGEPEGAPALPNTGSLVAIDNVGHFAVLLEGLNQPTSFEFLGNTAYVVTYGGDVWRIEGL